MAQFIIRVVLKDNATWDDYTRLASALAARNITDVITADDGRRYKMPPAEYQCTANMDASGVRQIAEAAISTVGKRYAVLVTQSQGSSWIGLDLA